MTAGEGRSVVVVGTGCIGLPAGLIGSTVADLRSPPVVLGEAAYKPDTADLGEDSALKIAENVEQDGYDITTYDPPFEEVRVACSVAEVVDGADRLVVLSTHSSVVSEMDQQRAAIEAARKTPRIL